MFVSSTEFSPSYTQQIVRSAFYGISFGTAYILMLLAMSYNGGVILAIFSGGAVGHFISAVSFSSSLIFLRRIGIVQLTFMIAMQRDTATIQEVETVDE